MVTTLRSVSQQTVEFGSLRPRLAEDERLRLQRQARVLAWGGIAWHFVEFSIAIAAGIAAGSIALIGFGADSLIEAVAGFVVVWLFTGSRLHSPSAERRAQQMIAVSFFVLAVYVGVEATRSLIGGDHPQASWVGIGLAAVTAPTMPLLARAKRRVGSGLESSATVKEGAQNMICAYLSIALLVGLLDTDVRFRGGADALLAGGAAPSRRVGLGGTVEPRDPPPQRRRRRLPRPPLDYPAGYDTVTVHRAWMVSLPGDCQPARS